MTWTQALLRAIYSRQRRGRRIDLSRVLPRLEELESRIVPYALSGDAWPNPQLITISFVPDGTLLSTSGGNNVYSNLQSTMNARFGSQSNWQNLILNAAQAWAQQTNINFTVVSDDGSAIGSGIDQQGDPHKGDIRIGGYNFGNNNLAIAYMPPPDNNYSIAGDIEFNTGQKFNNGSTYDLFTVATHEMGHALGMDHSGVISAAMYASYQGVKNSLTTDDVNGIRNIYSGGNARSYDSNRGRNNNFATATDITSAINSQSDTAVITGLDNTTTSDAEYYVIDGNAPDHSTAATITVQSKGLSLLAPQITVYASDQKTVLASASGSGEQGSTVSVSLQDIVGEGKPVYIKVTGANTTAFGTGAYALTVNSGTGSNPTVPLPNTTVANGSTIQGGGGSAVEISDEGLVNTTTTGVQQNGSGNSRSVASDARGNSVVVWQSQNQDGSGWGVYGQRYDASGHAVGGEFQINSTSQGDQINPSVAMAAHGNFVVTWQSQNQDGDGWGIFAQMYDAQGNALGSEFQVNTTAAGDQSNPSIATDANGDFVITWQSNSGSSSGLLGLLFGSQSSAIYGQMFDSQGNAIGGEFQANTTSGNQSDSSVAMDANGNFVVTWQSQNQDGSGWGIYGQQFDAKGNAVGGEFQVNTTIVGDQTNSSVAMGANGNYVVVWQSKNQDGSGWGIYGQQFDAQGNAIGGEFQVNTTTKGDQINPSVAMDANGDFVVAWQSKNQDGSGWGIYGQQFNSDGSKLGNEFLVNTTTKGDQQFPAVNLDNLGNLTIVWSGNGKGDSNGVFLKRYSTSTNPESGVGDQFETNAGTDDSSSVSPLGVAQNSPNSTRAITALAPTSGQLVEVNNPIPELAFDSGLSSWIEGAAFAGNLATSPTMTPVPSGRERNVMPSYFTAAWGLHETTSESELAYTFAVSVERQANPAEKNEFRDNKSETADLTDACFSDLGWMDTKVDEAVVGSTVSDGGDE